MSWYRGTLGLTRTSLGLLHSSRSPRLCLGLQRRILSAQLSTEVPHESSSQEKTESQIRDGSLFIDSVFPLKLGAWDLRYLVGYLREETLLDELHDLLSGVKAHNFRLQSLDPLMKDGGVFVNFQYESDNRDKALDDILRDLRERVNQGGGVPSWPGFLRGNIWPVKGDPWKEDLRRYASPALKVAFEGPDVNEETIYKLLRPYGRIMDISPPTPVPAGTLRSSTVVFRQVRAAATARNVVHGFRVDTGSLGSPLVTRLRINYQPPIQAHAIRDYIASHPRIFLPVLFFLLGTLTYTIFDPVRIFMVEGKMNGWFDYREFALYQWLRTNTVERFSLGSASESASTASSSGFPEIWKERQDAEGALKRYLSDIPNTVTFVHGPQGSGKTRMLNAVLKDTKRKTLIIDVRELIKANSDARLVSQLANQTGYWPVFSFLNSVNNLIDLASVGLIGQKTGFSSSLSEQLKQILEVVGTGLRRVNTSYRDHHERELKEQQVAEMRQQDQARVQTRIVEGIWHDGRLDCVAGNGVISELGIGDEWFDERDADGIVASSALNGTEGKGSGEGNISTDEIRRKQRSTEDLRAIEAMPVVVLRNFESKGGAEQREMLMDVLSQWAATLAENQVAHVIVISDNRENSKQLARALPSKPLNLIALSDADNASALSFVKQKLHDVDVEIDFTNEQISYVQRLGGRASDLESLIHKVRSGQKVEDAVEDIITRDVSELRKKAFGDDADDAKNKPWTREQAWILMKLLATKAEIPYHEVLVDYPFKSDEAPLRSMEREELISIVTQHGRPSSIKPGKPVYKFVFERLVNDPVFHAVQDIAYNTKLIVSAETMIKSCEEELLILKDVEAGTSGLWGSRSAVTQRMEYLLKNMKVAETKIENLEKQNLNLKKTLSKGG